MPWRIGAWEPGERQSSPHEGYSRVDTWDANVRGFTASAGRRPNTIPYIGGTARITIEDWEFTSADIFVGRWIAVRWDTGDDDSDTHGSEAIWPKGPPCVFAGLVVSFDTQFRIGKNGGVHSITTVVADDWMGSWAFNTPWLHNLPGSPDPMQGSSWSWLQRTRGVRNRAEGVLLEQTANGGVPDDNISTDIAAYGDFTIGEAIRRVTETTATEIFTRHGERIGQLDGQGPPREPDRASQFFIRSPQMVLRKVGSSADTLPTPVGVTTFDAANWRLTTDDGHSTPTSDNTGPATPGPPSTQRFRAAGRIANMNVNFPPIMDRVTLFSSDYSENVDGTTATGFKAEVKQGATFEKNWMERSQLVNVIGADDALQRNARAFLDGNNGYFKTYKIVLRNLTDAEMNLWTRIGTADEVILHALDVSHATTTGTICQVRHWRWDGSYFSGNMLTLEVVPHPTQFPDTGDAPLPSAIWSSVITWGFSDTSDKTADSGFDAPGGVRMFGDLANRDIDIDGDGTDDVEIDLIVRLDDGRIRVQVGTSGEYDMLEGKYMQLTNIASFPIWFVLPTGGTRGNTVALIPESEVEAIPLTGHSVGVALWESLPPGATLTPALVSLPAVVGSTQDTAVAALNDFNVIVTTEETSDADDVGDVLRTIPEHGTSVRPGSDVTIVVGVAEVIQMVPVPDVTNHTEGDARSDIEDVGLVATFEDRNELTGTDDLVIETIPAAGTQVAVGSTVRVVLRNLQALVPDVRGETRAEAVRLLEEADFVVGADLPDQDTDVGTNDNLVSRTSPAPGAQVDDGSTVRIGLWNYVPVIVQVAVPDLSGLLEGAARTAVEGAGLVAVFVDQDQTSGTDNQVISQSPTAGTMVDPGSTVTVTIRNLVAAQTTVPNLVGLTETAATQALIDANLTVGAVTDVPVGMLAQNDLVQTQNPAAGVTVDEQTAVAFTLGDFEGVVLPNLIGQPRNLAEAALVAEGLTVVFEVGTETSNSERENVVESMSPGPGMEVDEGSTVTLTIWDYVAVTPPMPTMLTTAEITVGNTGTWFGWRDSPTMGSVDPDPWQFNHDGHLVRVTRLEMRSTNGQIRLWVNDNTDAAEIENDLWVRLILPDRDTAVVFQLPSRNDNKFTIPNAVQPTSDVPAVGETVTAEFWDAQPSTTIVVPEPDPVKLWSSVMTWGQHPTAATPRAGFSIDGADTAGVSYGSLVPAVIPADDNFATAVTFERIARLIGENSNQVRVDVGDATQYDALEGKWMRIETTGQAAGDVIFQFPMEGGDGDTTESNPFAGIASPAVGTQIALSIWDRDPTGEDNTENYPVDPVQALWSGTITWQRAGGQGGWRSTGGSPYGNISPSPVTFARGADSITVTDLYRWGNNDMRFGTGNHAGNYAAAEGLWIKFELEDGDVVAQVSDESLGTTLASCTPSGVFSGTDRPESGDQIPVSIWEDDPR